MSYEADLDRLGRIASVPVGGVGILQFFTQRREDLFISEALRRGEEWEPFESLIFRSVVREGSLVCDVGANLGWYTVMAARLGASVIAFEPDPDTFHLLNANIRLNGCENVRAECIALSDRAGSGLLALSPDNQGDQRLVRGDEGGQRELLNVTVQRLDDVLGPRTVDVLKIDTQGAEASILRGASSTLAAGLGALLIEFWPRGLGSTTVDLVQQLAALKMTMFEVDSVDRALLPLSTDQLVERYRVGRYAEEGGDHLDLLLLTADRAGHVQHLIKERASGRRLAELLGPEERRRVELAVSCADAAPIPKVPEAGSIQEFSGLQVQIMHNGVRVLAGGYGEWTAEIISRLQGHHEPQEEIVFQAILERLASDHGEGHPPTIVELGACWGYYALWFLRSYPDGRAVLVEPDPEHLAAARRNLALNDRDATILEAAIGDNAEKVRFECGSGASITVDTMSLDGVLDAALVGRADIVVSDIQGAETRMLELACANLASRVRFLLLSTHHSSISGQSDTHERCLSIIQQCGGHIIAEHTVYESFSGDGLIAASFDPRDRDLTVRVSFARCEDSLFSPPGRAFDELQRHATNLERSFAAAAEYAHSLERHRELSESSAQATAAYVADLEKEVAQHRARQA